MLHVSSCTFALLLMTPEGCKKLWAEKLRADFSFPNEGQERLVGMSQRVFDHQEKFRGFEASGPNLRSPFALVSKRSIH